MSDILSLVRIEVKSAMLVEVWGASGWWVFERRSRAFQVIEE
jgi:hypothetical protein